MTDALVYWPRRLLVPRVSAINPAPATVGGPASLSGFRQAIASPAAVWSIRYEGIPVGSVAQRHIMRALAAQIDGRATPIALPVYDLEELRPLGTTTPATAPHDDDAAFGDDTLYGSSRAQVVAAAPAARGASQLTVTTILAAALQAGQHFSIGLRLYRIKSIEAVAGANTTFKLWPPLREAVIADAELEFDEPVVKARLVSDGALDLALAMGAHGVVSAAFLEDPT